MKRLAWPLKALGKGFFCDPNTVHSVSSTRIVAGDIQLLLLETPVVVWCQQATAAEHTAFRLAWIESVSQARKCEGVFELGLLSGQKSYWHCIVKIRRILGSPIVPVPAASDECNAPTDRISQRGQVPPKCLVPSICSRKQRDLCIAYHSMAKRCSLYYKAHTGTILHGQVRITVACGSNVRSGPASWNSAQFLLSYHCEFRTLTKMEQTRPKAAMYPVGSSS